MRNDPIIAALQTRFPGETCTRAGGAAGGDTSAAAVYRVGARNVFVKTAGGASALDMFAGERAGLDAIRSTGAIRCPEVFAVGEAGASAFVAMEHLALGPLRSPAEFGRQLALMHLHPAPRDAFGFDVDNTIGATPQRNPWTLSWIEFFREHRLGAMLDRLRGDRELVALGDRLSQALPVFFQGLTSIRPSLVHGDLWSGNWAGVGRDPVIYDPAAFYGHNEFEFGIMDMFGGPGPEFYRAYHAVIPRAAGHDDRVALYRLYHELNHTVLFGSGYRSSAMSTMRALLSSAKRSTDR